MSAGWKCRVDGEPYTVRYADSLAGVANEAARQHCVVTGGVPEEGRTVQVEFEHQGKIERVRVTVKPILVWDYKTSDWGKL